MTSRSHVIILVVVTLSSILLLITYTDTIETYSFMPDLPTHVKSTLCSVLTATCTTEANKRQGEGFSTRGRNVVNTEMFIERAVNEVPANTYHSSSGSSSSSSSSGSSRSSSSSSTISSRSDSESKKYGLNDTEQRSSVNIQSSQIDDRNKEKSQRQIKGRTFNDSYAEDKSLLSSKSSPAINKVNTLSNIHNNVNDKTSNTYGGHSTLKNYNSRKPSSNASSEKTSMSSLDAKSVETLHDETTQMPHVRHKNCSAEKEQVTEITTIDPQFRNKTERTISQTSKHFPSKPKHDKFEKSQSFKGSLSKFDVTTSVPETSHHFPPKSDVGSKSTPKHTDDEFRNHQRMIHSEVIMTSSNRPPPISENISIKTNKINRPQSKRNMSTTTTTHRPQSKRNMSTTTTTHRPQSKRNMSTTTTTHRPQSKRNMSTTTTTHRPQSKRNMSTTTTTHRPQSKRNMSTTTTTHRPQSKRNMSTTTTTHRPQSKRNMSTTTTTMMGDRIIARHKTRQADGVFNGNDKTNHNIISLSSDRKLNIREDEAKQTSCDVNLKTYSPRFLFPQTLDFVSSSKERQDIVSGHWLLNDLWRGRNLNKILTKIGASNLERDYEVLQHYVKRGGLNITHLSLQAWSQDAVLPWEMELLKTPPLRNLRDGSSYRKSKVTLLDKKETYAVGDRIRFRIDIYDGHGNQRRVGGDEVRLWMVEKAKLAAVSSHVTDLNNGSYLGEVVMRWPGAMEVKVELTFSRAALRLHHFFHHVTKCARFVAAGYVNGHASETTLCSTFPVIPGFKELCNHSDVSYGNGWYCGKPRHPNISCDNWTVARDMEYAEPFPFTSAESKLSKSLRQEPRFRLIPVKIALYVDRNKPQRLLKSCTSRNYSDSWDIGKPRGFFLARRWIRTDCQTPKLSTAKLLRCLRKTTLVFTGDSNLLMLFDLIHQTTGCAVLQTPGAHWHRSKSCTRPDIQFQMTWALHGFPAHALSDHWAIKGDFQWATTSLDAIPARGRFIVVVHLFIHMSMHHYSVFASRMAAIRRAAEALLARNPSATVVIRGPHTSSYGWDPVLGGDMMGTLFRQLTVRAFEGLHERVLFLDFWDMTIAAENPEFHPPTYINRAMLTVLFGHVCSHV